jgi:hypothetical protein
MEILQETKRFTFQMWLFPLKFPQQKMETTSIKHNNYGTMGLRITTFCELLELWSCHATWTPPDPTFKDCSKISQSSGNNSMPRQLVRSFIRKWTTKKGKHGNIMGYLGFYWNTLGIYWEIVERIEF